MVLPMFANHIFAPVFAIEVESIFGLVVLLITVLSWVVNVINNWAATIKGKGAAAPQIRPARPVPGDRPGPQTYDLNDFLKEITRNIEQKARPDAEPQRPTSTPQVRQPREKKPQKDNQKQNQKKNSKPPASPQTVADTRWSGQASSSPFMSRPENDAGIPPRTNSGNLAADGSEKLTHIDSGKLTGGTSLSAVPGSTVPTTSAASTVFTLLTSKDGIAQAMILNEVLQPPLARRRRA